MSYKHIMELQDENESILMMIKQRNLSNLKQAINIKYYDSNIIFNVGLHSRDIEIFKILREEYNDKFVEEIECSFYQNATTLKFVINECEGINYTMCFLQLCKGCLDIKIVNLFFKMIPKTTFDLSKGFLYACMYGNITMVKYLIGLGNINIHTTLDDYYDWQITEAPFSFACVNGNLALMKYLVSLRKTHGNIIVTTYYHALQNENPEVLKFVIKMRPRCKLHADKYIVSLVTKHMYRLLEYLLINYEVSTSMKSNCLTHLVRTDEKTIHNIDDITRAGKLLINELTQTGDIDLSKLFNITRVYTLTNYLFELDLNKSIKISPSAVDYLIISRPNILATIHYQYVRLDGTVLNNVLNKIINKKIKKEKDLVLARSIITLLMILLPANQLNDYRNPFDTKLMNLNTIYFDQNISFDNDREIKLIKTKLEYGIDIMGNEYASYEDKKVAWKCFFVKSIKF